MRDLDNYVQIMIESLQKKSEILDRLIKMNEQQASVLADEEFDSINWDKFNIIVAEKEEEIERINKMDEGFQALYDRVGEQLKSDKEQYASEIKIIQELIKELEDKSVRIRTGESRNKAFIDRILAMRKKDIKQVRTSLKAASSYYETMAKALEIGPISVDKKK